MADKNSTGTPSSKRKQRQSGTSQVTPETKKSHISIINNSPKYNSSDGLIMDPILVRLNDLEAKLETANFDIQELKKSQESQSSLIQELQTENQELKHKMRVIDGRLTRNERITDDSKEEILNNKAYSMKLNLIFSNITDTQYETKEQTSSALRDFLTDTLKLNSPPNFQVVHRIGQYVPGQNRSIVAKCNTIEEKGTILKNCKLLKNTEYKVNIQLPPELHARRSSLIPIYKDAKAANKNPKWVGFGEKMLLNGKIHTAHKDSIVDINTDVDEIAMTMRPRQSPPISLDKTTIQAHKAHIRGREEVIPALLAIRSDVRIARAKHNAYAYRFETMSGDVIEHYDDDGDWGAGRKILEQLQKNETSGILVCVCKWYSAANSSIPLKKYAEATDEIIKE